MRHDLYGICTHADFARIPKRGRHRASGYPSEAVSIPHADCKISTCFSQSILWSSWRLKSSKTRLFLRKLPRDDNKGNIKAPSASLALWQGNPLVTRGNRASCTENAPIAWRHYGSLAINNVVSTLQWRHNGYDGVSNHQPHDCLLNRLFRRRSTKTSKIRVTGLCKFNSAVTGEFSAQRASNAKECFHLMMTSSYRSDAVLFQ